jgi:Zn-dependent M28 family amino/carboxypeptidase
VRPGATAAVLLAALAGCGGVPNPPPPVTVSGHAPKPQPAPQAEHRFDARAAFADLRSEVAIGPRPAGSAADRRDARFIAGRLRAAGAIGVRIQRPWLNVVGRIPGTEPGTVVVGAHHDTKEIPHFLGANDGASGVAVVLGLARALAPRVDGPSIDFALFDAEESPGPGNGARAFELHGDRGSRQYVRYAKGGRQGAPKLASIDAMVLFDLVGDCDLRIPLEANSSPTLYGLFAEAASKPTPFGGTSGGVLDDHTPFSEAGIRALDMIDFDFGPGPPPGAWFHTTKDDVAHVCVSSLGAVGSAAVTALPRIR